MLCLCYAMLLAAPWPAVARVPVVDPISTRSFSYNNSAARRYALTRHPDTAPYFLLRVALSRLTFAGPKSGFSRKVSSNWVIAWSSLPVRKKATPRL
jgi:hypothetical protein